MNEKDIEAIAAAIVRKQSDEPHSHCRLFTETEVTTVKRFCDSLSGENWAKWQALLRLGSNMLTAEKAATGAVIVLLVGFIAALLGVGIKWWVAQ